MSKIWTIAKVTYRHRIWSGTFLILTFGLPLLMVVAGAIPVMQELGAELGSIGFVDQTGRLAPVSEITVDGDPAPVITFSSEEAATDAWEEGQVSGVVLVPADYFSTQRVSYYSAEAPRAVVESAITSILRRSLLPDQPEYVYERLSNPTSMEYVDVTRSQRLTEGLELILTVATPIALGLMFAIVVMTGTSQIGQAVVQEKDQRSMEMVITSVSPLELVAGKLAGMTLLSLTQVGIWLVTAVVVLGVAFADSFASAEISIPWSGLVWGGLLGVSGYFVYAVLSAGIGMIAGDRQQAQQMAGMLGFLGLFPLWFMAPIVQDPSGPLAIGLTLFPLTGPIVALFRMGISEVPIWQLTASFGVALATIVFGVWLVAKVFRASMLLYGQRFGFRQIVKALRESMSFISG